MKARSPKAICDSANPASAFGEALTGLTEADDGRLLIALYGAGVMQLAGDKVEAYPIRGVSNPTGLRDHDVDSNRLLRDRDRSLWIGTVERGLIHVHHGRTDVFSRSDGLSGDAVLTLFEDREGSIWVVTNLGLDRFRMLRSAPRTPCAQTFPVRRFEAGESF